MSIKYIYIVIIILTSCITFSQENNSKNVRVVEDFSKDLFNEEVEPKDIVDMYMAFKKTENRKTNDAKIFAAKFIQMTRDSVGKDMGWMFPSIKVKNLKNNKKVCLYQFIEDESKLELNHSSEVLKNAYVLINSDTNEIVEYFNVNGGKIYSFSLLGKGDRYWFFGFN